MNFEPTDDQQMIVGTFGRYLDEHSSIARVRQALPFGFDSALWHGLAELGALAIRVPEDAGGLGLSTLDAALLMEEAGRTLASGPLAEAILALRLLALFGGKANAGLLDRALLGEAIVTLALLDIATNPLQWVSGGAIADAVLARDGNQIILVTPTREEQAAARERVSLAATHNHAGEPIAPNLASMPIAEIRFDRPDRLVLVSGVDAVAAFSAVVEEWKLLTAATLVGIAGEAIRLAAGYAAERKAFGQLIGTFQAISHPLANLSVDADGGKYLVWKTIRDIADGTSSAAAQISMVLWWTARTAGAAGTQALHSFGGYGLTIEYDIHLYNLRARALPLLLGDPEALLAEAGRRRYRDERPALPDVGQISVDFDRGDGARLLAADVDDFFNRTLTPHLKARAHYSYAGHDDLVFERLAAENLLFPGWSGELGGRDADSYALDAALDVWEDHEWSSHSHGTTNLVGLIIQRFGSADLKAEALSQIVAGKAVCCLGFSEPGSGSDVFAAATRAIPDGNGWRISGSKMFTSGANISKYVLMLARTNVDVPKHRGLTMFIVPLNAAGVEIQPIYTFQDERTNITYYDDVYIPDSYRLGPVDGGAKVMAATLELEHGVSFVRPQRHLLHAAERFCRETVSGGVPLIEKEDTLRRLARAATHVELATVIHYRALWSGVEGKGSVTLGPASKLFSSERFQEDSADLLNLAGQAGLSKDGLAGLLNQAYRHAHATTVYGGTSEVHRSMIAERQLGLSRSRG